MNQILITDENYQDFKTVLPAQLSGRSRTTIGAYNDEGFVCGAISMEQMEDRYDIDWLFVLPAVRRRGIGTKLVTAIVDLAEYTGGLSVQSIFEAEDAEKLYDFFLSDAMQEQLFEISYLCQRFYVLPEALGYLEGIKVKVEGTSELFFKLPMYRQYQILEMISSQYEVRNFDIWENSCTKDLCRVIYRGDKLEALIFFSDRTDGDLELTFLYGKSPKSLIRLMSDTFDEKKLRYPEAKIIFDAMTPSSERLARKLFPEAKTVPLYEAER